jgi:type I restriction enzyme S subunit
MSSLPSEDEQDEIVAELEKQFSRLDEAVANLQRVKANLKRYKASVLKAAVEGRLVETEATLARREGRTYETGEQLLQRILNGRSVPDATDKVELLAIPEGWTWVQSDVLFDFVTSGSRGWAKFYANVGAKFLRVGNLDHGTIDLDLSALQYVAPPGGSETDRSRVAPGDLLISITAELGMIALVSSEIGEAYVNQHVAIARTTRPINKSYLAWFFASEHGGKRQLEALRKGATKAGLGLDDIRSVAVALPPHGEQARIVAEIDRHLSIIREVEAEVDASLQRAQALRQATLAKAFSS